MVLWNETVPVRPSVKPLVPAGVIMPSLADPEVQHAVTAVVVRLMGRKVEEGPAQWGCLLNTARLEWEIRLGALAETVAEVFVDF